MRKQRGMMSLYLFIPIFTALFACASLCFALSSKQADFYNIRAENIAAENIWAQVEAVTVDWFAKALRSGEISPDFSDTQCENPAISLPEKLLQELAAADSAYTVNAYIVDENYADSWQTKAQKLAIPKNTPTAVSLGITGGTQYSKKYMLICEISKKQNANQGKNIFTTELLVTSQAGVLKISRLNSRRDYVTE